jgi:hypothetical protein
MTSGTITFVSDSESCVLEKNFIEPGLKVVRLMDEEGLQSLYGYSDFLMTLAQCEGTKI